MRPFESDLADTLNAYVADDEISHVGLGKYNLSIGFDGGKLPVINAESKVDLSISGTAFEWTGEPIAAPIWMLLGQRVARFELISELILRLHLASGDYVDFQTDERPYEAVVMDFGIRGDAKVMEIF